MKNKTKYTVRIWYYNYQWTGKKLALDKSKLVREKIICKDISVCGEKRLSFNQGGFCLNIDTKQMEKIIIEKQ